MVVIAEKMLRWGTGRQDKGCKRSRHSTETTEPGTQNLYKQASAQLTYPSPTLTHPSYLTVLWRRDPNAWWPRHLVTRHRQPLLVFHSKHRCQVGFLEMFHERAVLTTSLRGN